ncbi:uncharacterized protein NFIA_060700 [Aspergillus fischeri NRRL 181]|uniref:SET domain protein n=1 Tax=Neosartorya fischeri (strain ATCC 1020 / DSM 3700 / CBS 544.65 / FGSC A1164 / JCM 1740 / NRRL 181 / WB 181) TaxID=331117 RepID=A1DPJ3_NEOFI|nr:uncharacterized protein NFIA_060700 [Aspergillus fischeri NRRL 181]EAW16714.1 hypothetical protein NFIA_060700 [Aspergillus fischeri NRRL 181]KAG2002858.1 hypothetical protein GB937_009394 [Aspergillus fischeri]
MEAAIHALTSQIFDEIFALFGVKKSERIDPLITELSGIGEWRKEDFARCEGSMRTHSEEEKAQSDFEWYEHPRLVNEIPKMRGDGTNGKRRISDEAAGTKGNLGNRLQEDEEAAEANEEYNNRAITATSDNLPANEVTVSASSQVEAESQLLSENPLATSANVKGPGDPSSEVALVSRLPPWLDSGYASKVVATVLVNCVRLNSTIGLHGHQTWKGLLSTDPSWLQNYAESISTLEYCKAVRAIKRDNAVAIGWNLQSRFNETVYWDIILKGAKRIDVATLPRARGPDDGFTSAEKAATKRLMEDLGYGLSPESQRQHCKLWKGLFDMRQAGINKFLIYCTQEFDSYCKTYPQSSETSLIDTVAKWEKAYGSYIEQLEYLVSHYMKGDVARKSYVRFPPVAARLTVPGQSWNDAGNAWFSADEESSFTPENGAIAVPPDNLGVAFGGRSLFQDERDKSIFMLLAPRDDDQLLSVRSLIPVYEGDFLGVFLGTIRSKPDFGPKWGVPGPQENLWLDYSQVTGTLNQMRDSRIGGLANVRLHWELFSDQDVSQPRLLWRVSVKALKAIGPMEELIREAPHEDQYLLHQSADYAQWWFINRAL